MNMPNSKSASAAMNLAIINPVPQEGRKMKIGEVFPSKYLKAADLQGRNVTVEIKHVELEEVGSDRETRPVIYFVGKDKGLVLNKTNADVIGAIAGDETDDWVGVKIVLFETMASFQGKPMPAIRCKLAPQKPGGTRLATPPKPEPPPAEPLFADDPDDSIPF
jgi:hypothetical protein